MGEKMWHCLNRMDCSTTVMSMFPVLQEEEQAYARLQNICAGLGHCGAPDTGSGRSDIESQHKLWQQAERIIRSQNLHPRHRE